MNKEQALVPEDGREVLAEINMDHTLQHFPVVILTSSQAERDGFESYSLGANCHVTKTVDLKTFRTIVRTVEEFWFSAVTLPPQDTSTPM